MNGAIIGVFLVIIAYLVMMLAIGFFYSKGNNDSSDFYLGGRKLGSFCDGHECGGIGYEQLAADGTAGSGLSQRYL